MAEIARGLGKGEKTIIKGWRRLGQGADERSPLARIVAMRLPTGKLLALACPGKPHRALAAHRQGSTIETMFANPKTKGFNLEDTHIADPGKLSTLLAVLALTVTPRVKTGVAALQKIAASAKPAQVIAFLHQILTPALPLNQLKSMAI